MKTRDILLRQCLVGVFFVLWGILWLALYHENTFGKALSGFFIILGIFISIKSYNKWKKWKDSGIHTDETLTDERSELNLLRASRAGFMFLYVSITVFNNCLVYITRFKADKRNNIHGVDGPCFCCRLCLICPVVLQVREGS